MTAFPEPTVPHRRSSLLLVAAALAVTACGADDGQGDDPGDDLGGTGTAAPLSPAPEDIGTADDTPTPTATVDSDLSRSCALTTSVGDVSVRHPDGWSVGETCEVFDPSLEQVPEDPTTAAVHLRAVDTPYAEVAASTPDRIDGFRATGAVDGRQAVRIEATLATDDGEVPVVQWVVDLDPATDEAGGTLVATATGEGDVDPGAAVAVLDDMARALDLGDTPSGVVTSVEGGGTPFAVRLEDGCLRLAPSPTGETVDESCDVLALDDDLARTTTLSGGGVTVVVGQVPAVVDVVRDDGMDGVGALTLPTSDDLAAPRVFALRAADDATLRLFSFDGTDRGTLTVGAR